MSSERSKCQTCGQSTYPEGYCRYCCIEECKTGKVVFEGLVLSLAAGWEIEAGDTYFTPGRNTGPKLLTCREHNHKTSVVFPVEMAYAFDTWECYKVTEME